MEQLNLPFRLGMDYEELEFELEVLPDRIKGYDSYLYIGEFNSFLNYNTERIELLFRIDVLEGIIINLPLLEPECIVTSLESLLGTPQVVSEENFKFYKFNLEENSLLLCLLKDAVYILLCDITITYSLHLSLLCCHF